MAQVVVSPPVARRRSWRTPIAARRPRWPLRWWQLLWAPFWLGSEVPVFIPSPPPPATSDLGPAGDVVLRELDRLGIRLWFRHTIHLLVRAVWLTLAVGCVWQALDLAGGPRFDWPALLWIAAPLGTLALVFAGLNRPARADIARMLDRSFGLRDRLATALDHLGQRVPRQGERASIVYLQMADAANVIHDIKQHRSLRFSPPIRELVPTLGFALLLAALFFLRGSGEGIPEVAAASVPRFTPAVARPPAPEQAALSPENTVLAPTVEEVMEQSRRSNAAQRDLRQLAAALADHASTRPAAEAINQGDYEAAGDLLREFAPRSDQLSPAAREALARDLDQAAAGMTPENAGLQQATGQAAAGLREGGTEAQTGVEELGDEVARTGDDVASQQELADQMQRAQEAERQQRPAGASPDGSNQANQSGQSESSQSGEPGSETGDAAPQGSEPGDGSQPGESAGGQGEPSESGQAGSGEGDPGGQPGESMAGQGGEPMGPEGQAGNATDLQSSEGSDGSQGGGAAGGASESDVEGVGQGLPGEGPGPGPGQAEQRVTGGDGERVQAPAPGATSSEVQLPSSPGGDGLQTVNNAGGTVRGSGAGITAGAGNAVQAEVAAAGPDSNRVPEAYRPVVERYFSNLDDD